MAEFRLRQGGDLRVRINGIITNGKTVREKWRLATDSGIRDVAQPGLPLLNPHPEYRSLSRTAPVLEGRKAGGQAGWITAIRSQGFRCTQIIDVGSLR